MKGARAVDHDDKKKTLVSKILRVGSSPDYAVPLVEGRLAREQKSGGGRKAEAACPTFSSTGCSGVNSEKIRARPIVLDAYNFDRIVLCGSLSDR
jgi:hypothetical protein